MALRVIPLASGSQGNATLVEFGTSRLLVDAGVSARTLARRLETAGVAPESIDCIVLSHEHTDHARGAECFSRRHAVPVACSPATLEAMGVSHVHLAEWLPFEAGGTLEIDRLRVTSFPVPHDAADPVGFVVEGGGVRFGVVTDLGHATTLVVERLRHCHGLLIEANHCPHLLREGPYPWRLKQRVSGRNGHLSNQDAASVLRRVGGPELEAVVLAHLSEQNNTPQLAREAASRALGSVGASRARIGVAASRAPTPALEIG